MPYIGNTIRAADDYRLIDDISSSFNGSTTSFALQVAGSSPVPFPKSPQQVLISVNGVIQEPDPTGSSGFNLVGTNIVFSSAPTNGHAFFGIIYATADYLNSGGNFPAGSVGAPSLTFIGDENTGIYRKGSGSVGFVADATEIANTDSNGLTISSGNLILGDSSGASDDRIKLGASGDLQIYHDGSNTRIANSTGDLKLQGGGDDILLQPVDTEIALKAVPNGAVELYFDNAKKAETVTGGFTITGVCTATSFAGDGSSLSGINTDLVSDTSPQLGGDLDTNGNNIDFGDSSGASDDRAVFGADTDMQLYHTGSQGVLDNDTGLLDINTTSDLRLNVQSIFKVLTKGGSENCIIGNTDGSVELYFNNVKKFETTNDGVDFGAAGANDILCISGQTIHRTGGNGCGFHFSSQVVLPTNAAGTTTDNHTSIGNSSNRFQNVHMMQLNVHDRVNSHLKPYSNNTYDLGSTTYRWRNLYTNDLNLSNEGSSNEVDGTWGSYTIQEGVEDLFLINKRNGKKYKFNLTEVA